MSRQQDYNQYSQYGQYGQQSQFNRPESSRNWSEEAVRGSWESSYQRSMATSPRDRSSTSRPRAGVSRTEYEPRANMVDSWLGQQRTQDPSRVVDAVSDFATPESSPVISDGSSTFQTRPAYGTPSYGPPSYGTPAYRTRHSDRTPVVPPEYYTTSSPSRTYRQSSDHGSSSRDVASYSAEHDLRGIGSFTENDRSREPEHKVKYKPLTNWFDMWLP